MPERDQERLEAAERVWRELAIENQLSRAQAKTYVRCLQATWQVPTIQWTERDSARQLADARRLLHAAHIFRSIEGQASQRAIDCYRRTGEILEWLSRAADTIRSVVPIELLAAGAYQLGGLPAMASGLLSQVGSDHEGVRLYSAFLRADFDGVLRRAALFWRRYPDLTTADASAMLLTAMRSETPDGEAGPTVGWAFSVELVRSLGLVADCLRRGDDERLAVAMAKLRALDAMATRTFSDDASLVITIMRAVADSFVAATIYRPLRALCALRPDRISRLLAYARDQFSRGRGILWTSQQHGLQRLLEESSFALCTPTGSGKTLVANLALIKELLLREDEGLLGPLALYIVPSRALAGEVEAKLTSELGRDVTVTGLYGGADSSGLTSVDQRPQDLLDPILNSPEPGVVDEKQRIEDLVMAFRASLVRHVGFQKALDEISRCHRLGRYRFEEPNCLFITGESGCGKSTLRRAYANQYPRYEAEERTVIPVLQLELPSQPTVKNVAERILMELGDPFAGKGSAEGKTARIVTLLKECAVELVILDEFQHFVDRSSEKVDYKVADWLKSVINASKVPFVLMGLPRCHRILEANEQLRRRFLPRASLHRFRIDKPEERKQFYSVLKSLEKGLPLQTPTALTEKMVIPRIYYATHGVIDHTMKLVSEGLNIALDIQHMQQTKSHLRIFRAPQKTENKAR